MTRTFEIAFQLAGKINSSFGNMFTSASARMNQLNQRIISLKSEMRALERAQRAGTIGAQEYAEAYARLAEQLQRVEAVQRRLAITTKLDRQLTNIGKKALGYMKLPAMAAMGVTAISAPIIFAGSLSKAMAFEAQLSSIQALTGLTGEQMAKMKNLALEMGAKTKYSALEAAQGIEELLKAGLTPAAVQAGALEAALNLAAAGGLELAEAAEIMSTALNAYRADNMRASDAADILAGTANAAATSVEELRYSLASVSAVASGVGMSFKDTNIALGLFANNGLKGSDAGTSLKTMLMNLQPSTKQQIDLFKKLGIITRDNTNRFFTAEGKLKSLEEIASILREALKDLTDQQRMAYLEVMFGSDAIRAANIIYKEGAEGVKKFANEMTKFTALEVARQKMNNAAGAVEQFKGALETLQISAMYPFLPLVKRIAEGAADLTQRVGPQITASMESAAQKVEDFFARLSADEKFQQMNWGEKINYALRELIQAINEWLSGGGGKQVKAFGEQMGTFISIGLEGAAPILVKSAETAGEIMGKAVISAFGAALQSSPFGAIIVGALGGAAIGSVVPGVGTAAGALAGAGAGLASYVVSKSVSDISAHHEKIKDEIPEGYITRPAPFSIGAPRKRVGVGDLRAIEQHARGGILTRPHLGMVAEAGPEAVIPLTPGMRSRALALWQRVGFMLGAAPEMLIPAGQAVITPVLGAVPRLPELAGSAVYRATVTAPRLPEIKAYAHGGILTRPHLGMVAEAGPEAVIPLDGSRRSVSLWQKAGEMLGVVPARTEGENTININVTFAPVVHGAGPGTMSALKEQQRYFVKELEEVVERKVKEMTRQKRRLSYE